MWLSIVSSLLILLLASPHEASEPPPAAKELPQGNARPVFLVPSPVPNFWDNPSAPSPEPASLGNVKFKDTESTAHLASPAPTAEFYGYGREGTQTDLEAKIDRLERKVARLQTRRKRYQDYMYDTKDAYVDSLVAAIAVPMIRKGTESAPDPRSYIGRIDVAHQAITSDIRLMRAEGSTEGDMGDLYSKPAPAISPNPFPEPIDPDALVAAEAAAAAVEPVSDCAEDDLDCQIKEFVLSEIKIKQPDLEDLNQGLNSPSSEAALSDLEKGVKKIVSTFKSTKPQDLERLEPRSSDALVNKVISAIHLKDLVRKGLKMKEIAKDGSALLERIHSTMQPRLALRHAMSREVGDSFEEATTPKSPQVKSSTIAEVRNAFDMVTVKSD